MEAEVLAVCCSGALLTQYHSLPRSGKSKSYISDSVCMESVSMLVSMLDAKVHHSAGLFVRVARKMATWLRFAKLHLEKTQEQWSNVLWIVEVMHSSMFGEDFKKGTNTSFELCWWWGDDFGLFSSHRTWTPCSHWVSHELLCIPKYSRVKYEAITLTAKALPKMAHVTAQWPQAQQNDWKRKESMCWNGPVNPIEMTVVEP